MPIYSYIISVALGLGLSFAFSPFNFWPLFLLLVPLFILIANSEKARHAYSIGFFFAASFFAAHILWLPQSLSSPNLFGAVAWLIYPPIFLLEGVFFGIVAYLSRKIAGKRRSVLWLLPVFWLILEWARTQGPLAFPWGSFSYIWIKTPIAQLAEFTGSLGLGLFTLTIISLLAVAFIDSDFQDRIFSSSKTKSNTRYLAVVLAIAIFAGGYFYGVLRLKEKLPEADKTVLLVQGNTDPLGRSKGATNDFEVYQDLTKTALKDKRVDLLVWPEGAVLTQELEGLKGEENRLKIKAAGNNSDTITGVSIWEFFPEGYKGYNAVLGISNARVIGRYNKIYLVPFGEGLIYSKLLLPVYKVVFSWFGLGAYGRTPGTEIVPINFSDKSVASYVCYESVFPQIASNMVKKGAQVLVNISNDAWFGNGAGAGQHYDMGSLRAIETKRYILRAGNDGITAIIDPYGRTTKRIARFEASSLLGKFSLREGLTFYVRYGHWLIYVLAVYAIVVSVYYFIKNKNQVNSVKALVYR